MIVQRHSNDKLQAECTRLHACASAAMASATKHRQLAASFGMLSPSSAKKTLFSSSGALRSPDKHPRRERHSSTGTASTYASTQVRQEEDEKDDEVESENDENDAEEEEDDEEVGSGTEVDENESRSNTPVASPASSPSVDKLGKMAAAQFAVRQSAGLEEEYWATQI